MAQMAIDSASLGCCRMQGEWSVHWCVCDVVGCRECGLYTGVCDVVGCRECGLYTGV